jgi:hypothetical protein
MTRTPLPSYPGNNLIPITSRIVPITSKAASQQSRFAHTQAKSKMAAAPNQRTTLSTSAASTKSSKRKPVDVLRTIMSAHNGASSSSEIATEGKDDNASKEKTLTFQKPSEEDIAAYDIETVKGIRANNVELLRKLWESGKSMDACNQFGESLIHMACRRGYVKVLEFMLLEVKVRTERCDDFGRNPFHDAMWTPTPNFELMDLLIDHADPEMMLLEDVRGNTPFAYARADHGEQWISFLEKRKDKLLERLSGGTTKSVVKESPVKDSPVKVVG